MSFFNPVNVLSATIADAASTSENVDCDGFRAFGINVPATVAGVSATFQVSDDGTTWKDLYKNDNTALSVSITAGKFIGFGDWIPYFAPWRYVRIVSSAAASGADEEWELVVRYL